MDADCFLEAVFCTPGPSWTIGCWVDARKEEDYDRQMEKFLLYKPLARAFIQELSENNGITLQLYFSELYHHPLILKIPAQFSINPPIS